MEVNYRWKWSIRLYDIQKWSSRLFKFNRMKNRNDFFLLKLWFLCISCLFLLIKTAILVDLISVCRLVLASILFFLFWFKFQKLLHEVKWLFRTSFSVKWIVSKYYCSKYKIVSLSECAKIQNWKSSTLYWNFANRAINDQIFSLLWWKVRNCIQT